MAKQLWINLPVKDVNRSKAFFTEIGFKINTHFPTTDNATSLVFGDQNIVVMLFKEATFQTYIHATITDTSTSNEVLFSVGAESVAEVDEIAAKAVAAGGTSDHKPKEVDGWMYGCLFSDLDGHKWNVLYMDMTKMPQP